ncbi:hypothetical protein AAFC00_000573 [Neodothiora populina]|uniref:NAD(P)-binding protein n=1 Tax=Neodothiora populina TaxID=2781224 RepID=A0ABR3PEH5_9PEZI
MADSSNFDLGLGLENTHVVVTGGAGLIGSVVVTAFLRAGAKVTSMDISYPNQISPSPTSETKADPPSSNLQELHCDITSATSLASAWQHATAHFGTVETCVALASLDLSVLPQTDSLADADAETIARVLATNIGGTFATAQMWLRGIREHVDDSRTRRRRRAEDADADDADAELKNPCLILVGSEAGHFGVRTQAAYAASKSAVQYGLLQSLRADAPRICARARVNAVAPGPVDTPRFHEETGGQGTMEWWAECEATTALRQPVPVQAVARSVLFLASERWSSNVHGQVLNVDSGKQGALMWAHEGETRKVLQDG